MKSHSNQVDSLCRKSRSVTVTHGGHFFFGTQGVSDLSPPLHSASSKPHCHNMHMIQNKGCLIRNGRSMNHWFGPLTTSSFQCPPEWSNFNSQYRLIETF